MKVAHLITAHAAPDQLGRLILRIQHPSADVYVLIDLKADITPFLPLADLPNVTFIRERIKIYWGEYSQVQSTLVGFKEILASGKKYDFINFLSGSDYPVQPIEKFHDFLARNPDKAFMEFYDIESVWQEAKSRISTYHLGAYRIKGIFQFQKILNAVTPPRKVPLGMTAVGRSSWFTLPIASIRYILEFLEKNPKVDKYFKMVWGSDEIIFQTILYNSPFKDQLVNDNLRYIDWSKGGVNPKTLTMEDKHNLLNTNKFFARKFNGAVDNDILDFIDEEILEIRDI